MEETEAIRRWYLKAYFRTVILPLNLIYIYTYIHTYMHTYIHTYKHTYILT